MTLINLPSQVLSDERLSQKQREDLIELYQLSVKDRYFLISKLPVLALAGMGTLGFVAEMFSQRAFLPEPATLSMYGLTCMAVLIYYILKSRSQMSLYESDKKTELVEKLEQQGLKRLVREVVCARE